MQKRNLTILISLLLAPLFLAAQPPRVINLTPSDELPQVIINDIAQDYEGYIWLATSKGLYQFDGSKYRLYGNNTPLRYSNIAALYVSQKDSSLWITARDGRTWRKKNQKLITQSVPSSLQKTDGAPIQTSIIETDSTLHFYTYSLDKFSFASDSLIKKDTVNYLTVAFDLMKKLKPKWQQKVALFLQLNLVELSNDERFKRGKITLFSNNEKAIINFGNLVIEADEKNIKSSYNSNMVLDMKEVEGVILKSIYSKGLIIQKSNGQSNTILPNHTITKIFVDKHNEIWTGTANGDLFYIQNIHTTHYQKPFSDIATHNNDLLLAEKTGKVYTLIHGELDEIKKLPYPAYRIHDIDSTRLAVTGIKNISILEINNRNTTILQNANVTNDFIHDYTILNNQLFILGNNGVLTYHIDAPNWDKKLLIKKSFSDMTSHRGKIIATNDNGVWEITKTGKFHRISNRPVTYLAKSNSTLFLMDPQNQLSIINNGDEETVFSLPNHNINHIEQVKNELLISTNTGVYRALIPINQSNISLSPIIETEGLNIKKTVLYDDTLYALHKNGLLRVPFQNLKPLRKHKLQLYSPNLTKKKHNEFLFKVDQNTETLIIGVSKFNFTGKNAPKLFYRSHNDTTTHTIESNTITISNLKAGSTQFQLSYDAKFKESKHTYRVIINKEKHFYEKTDIQIIAFLFITGLIVMLVMRRIEKIKRKNKLQNAQIAQMQTVLQQQMNPHFIFNSLTSINHYILQNKPMDSSRYLTKFSVLIRNILDNSKKELIPLAEELETLRIYLDLELLRFKDRFTYSINLAPDVDKNMVMLPPFILQPYVESALRDGIIHKPGKGNILLNIRYLKFSIQCTIVDDGIGRPDSLEQHTEKEKFKVKNGTHIAKQRIEIYNRLNSRKISVHKEDMINHENKAIGTKVILNFPVNH